MLAIDFLNNLGLGFIDDNVDGNNFPFQESNIRYIGMARDIWLLLVPDVQRCFYSSDLLFYFYLYFLFQNSRTSLLV